MLSAEQIRFILLEEFVKAQTRNPRYSMRSYAARVGISQAAISEILAGKRPITRKSAEKILQGLGKAPNEISELLDRTGSVIQQFESVDMDTYRLISDWHYYAILSLAETEDFKSRPDWIAKRLGIPVSVADEAIERLLRLGMLTKSPKTGKLAASGKQLEAISSLANPALKKANRQNLELALDALDQTAFEQRDFTGITFCFDPSRMEDARKLIKNFRRDFNRVMESGRKKEVYKLCVQLFPLSKGELK